MQNNTFSTLFVGQNLIRLSAVDSTNNFLKEMVSKSEPLPEGTVIMADNQFAGRGQQENTWHATAGLNLTFSIFFKPAFLPINKQFMLNIAVSIGVRKALQQIVPQGIKVKWPNDIYFGDRKLGGILIENTLSGNCYKSSIVGIGINVNQEEFNPDQVKRATSLCKILQADVNLIDLLGQICGSIEAEYFKLKSGNYTALLTEYLKGLYRFNEEAAYREGLIIFKGRIRDVTETGQLIIEVEGRNKSYNFKEIEFLNNTR
ncbi:biotin--[acetyl-CoA-carboxylase] ligase [Pedobacter frigoris]|uniref:Biotin--[acetyl-CoA-carboxylase] ligase n=1 Tax=Pedobacter frigoris TaxID=2571272 RepID=A0A4U1CF14_9SPHI|nr:biotin--[acetyl-CoA-carboxylase] ligase [Pedobacter frigoris]TKC04917.1 biotin--[acetyl-CoA-carboxylase] ligase [Pedobacter frigoris]